ncbi:ethanolamine ammonia-lyase [Arcobacter suis]|uniref:Ethanolamine ammonia-lyase small subunit n=1 Tax=Arcobacter suis CECT 7833 TaxID=663365 RepID=A0AAD0SSM7_9BACT|nr:ethanolamine ammonia-lyase subunit EutC [Arcobacter suis]AXX90213.1 ethanolamine ammonia-lyase, beta subunit [Arcobacter suis CECT 7833]RWS45539.1 ethanolamine ammonia-lyase [Arcobacter suis]
MNNIEKIDSNIIENPWALLKDYTDARIGLGRSGVSIPTSHSLAFQLAHAQAQDAVHLPLDVENIVEQLIVNDINKKTSPILLHSQAINRTTYLQRPDLGRRLDKNSSEILKKIKANDNTFYDLSIVIVDGLSSLAIKENAINFIKKLMIALKEDKQKWNLSPFSIVQQGRVAIGDEVGELLKAKISIVLIGERPGLSSPDSLGLYLTWNPKVGLSDASRNCISNIRSEGLSYEEAVKKTMYLLKESRRLELSGVNLKDRTINDVIENSINEENFLIK